MATLIIHDGGFARPLKRNKLSTETGEEAFVIARPSRTQGLNSRQRRAPGKPMVRYYRRDAKPCSRRPLFPSRAWRYMGGLERDSHFLVLPSGSSTRMRRAATCRPCREPRTITPAAQCQIDLRRANNVFEVQTLAPEGAAGSSISSSNVRTDA